MKPSKPKTRKKEDQHLLIGGGGTKSILAGIGAYCGLKSNRPEHWSTIGGISGGSIPAAFIARGFSPVEMLRLSVRTDFKHLLIARRHVWRVVRRYLDQKGTKLPIKALMSSKPLGDFVDEMIPEWPERFWTLAMTDVQGVGRCQIVFTKEGVFRYSLEGDSEQIADSPPSVGTAVRATCAIPGLIGAVEFEGMHLFDGMLTWDGACPVGVVGKHFQAEAEKITAIDVGRQEDWFGLIHRRYMRYWCGKDCKDAEGVFQSWVEKGITYIEAPHVADGAVKLDYTTRQKWAALKAAYRAARNER